MAGRLKGIHRRAWYENQTLFHDLEPVLQRFHAAGIECMLLKGAALVLQYYRDMGLRPMRDLDVLVPEERAAEALQLMQDDGWRVLTAWPGELTESFRRFRHAVAMQHESGRQLDLHWHVLYGCCRQGADDDFWAASVPLELHGVTVRALGASAPMSGAPSTSIETSGTGIGWSALAPGTVSSTDRIGERSSAASPVMSRRLAQRADNRRDLVSRRNEPRAGPERPESG